MDFVNRVLAVIASLFQFLVHVLACLACGYLLGGLLGDYFAHNASAGHKAGLGVAGFLALGTFADAFASPGLRAFVSWWFQVVALLFVAIALAVSAFFFGVDLAIAYGLNWDRFFIQLASGALSLLVWLPLSIAVVGMLFSPAVLEWIEERIVSGGLSSARAVDERARQLGASRPRRP